VNDVTNPPGYGESGASAGHAPAVLGPLADTAVVALAVVTALAVRSGHPVVATGVALAVAVTVRSIRRVALVWLLLAVLLAMAGSLRSQQSWADLAPDRLGTFAGWARIVDDPQPYPSSTRVIVEIEGERFETWARGRARQQRVMRWRGGEWVQMAGERRVLDPERTQRVAWQHVVGVFELAVAADVVPGAPVARASNRVRSTIERAAATIPEPYGALYRGLVIGDDRDQPRDMIERFRASGLSHLTAVSGQNVAFVLAACGPLLVRLRPWPRFVATVAVIAWFVVLTRVEPSILRAGVMAGLSALAFTTGRERSPVRILAVAVIVLLLVDPLLGWSVGFWLSVGATAGVCAVGPWLADRLRALGIFAMPLGITLGAQLGVALPSVLVFGRLPLMSIVANLLAVPVAGMVMLYGLPAGVLAGVAPTIAPVVMFPAWLGTRWVDTVAVLGARLEPEPPWSWVGWGIVASIVAALLGWGRLRRS
jgi:competence protein ComEC